MNHSVKILKGKRQMKKKTTTVPSIDTTWRRARKFGLTLSVPAATDADVCTFGLWVANQQIRSQSFRFKSNDALVTIYVHNLNYEWNRLRLETNFTLKEGRPYLGSRPFHWYVQWVCFVYWIRQTIRKSLSVHKSGFNLEMRERKRETKERKKKMEPTWMRWLEAVHGSATKWRAMTL